MNELHLFAGGGGGILGGMLLGHRPVCAVEIKPFCRTQLLQRQRDGMLPWFPIWDDVTTFDGLPWKGVVDVVCGGFPCQDISCAGTTNGNRGLAGKRSGLWGEMARIVREVGPEYVFVENSPRLTSRGLGVVLGDLAEMGYDARWGIVSAACVGAPISESEFGYLPTPDASLGMFECPGQMDLVTCFRKETSGVRPSGAKIGSSLRWHPEFIHEWQRTGGELNAQWIEALMGWPIDWTASTPVEMAKFHSWLQLHGISSSPEY